MIELDCMELANCFSEEDLVNEIFNQCPELAPPIPVEEIAKAAGIIDIKSLNTEDFAGMLVSDSEKSYGVIYYKEGSRQGRKRFTIGHELGHFLLLHHSSKQNCTARDMNKPSGSEEHQKMEKEANKFSELLLMPDKLVTVHLGVELPDLNIMNNIAKVFDLSFQAMANKCVTLSKVPIALVYSKHGKITYIWKNRLAYRLKFNIDKNQSMPSMSQAILKSKPIHNISNIETVESEIWFNKFDQSKKLVEQTITQENGYKVTMLRIDG